MANYVRISTLGAPRHSLGNMSHQEAVDHMVAYWREQVSLALRDQPDLILLPEWCDHYSGQALEARADYYEVRGNSVRDMLAGLAKSHSCYIAYSAAREGDDGAWRNSMQMIDRSGDIVGIYDKNYLTFEEIEAEHRPGKDIAVIECDLGRVGCALCFDLNFHELAARYAADGVDLILFASLFHGGILQQHWALTCQAYFAGAISGAGLPDSVINPLGEIIAKGSDEQVCLTQEINLDFCVVPRGPHCDQLDAMQAKYGERVTIKVLPLLGRALVTSEMDGMSATDLLNEFGIEPLSSFHERAARGRAKLL